MYRLQQVNTTDLHKAIRLGCQTMCQVFNADDHDIPFFASFVRPEAYLAFSPDHSEAHVPGRHLNALLLAQAACDIAVPEVCIDKHAKAAYFSFSGPVPLPLNRSAVDGPLNRLVIHNIREGLHALYALARYRKDAQASELFERSVACMLQYWSPEAGWQTDALQALGLEVVDWSFIGGIARAIGPLVKYYRHTGHGPSLYLAQLLARKACRECYASGAFSLERLGAHTHSITCVLSSLAQLANLTGDAAMMATVKQFYDHGLWRVRDELGWALENAGPQADPDRGEGNTTGDLIETALLLGAFGYPEYYGDAERMLRGHLLPSQILDTSFIPQPPNPGHVDGLRDLPARHKGAFGFPAPYGHETLDGSPISFNMDIVGGVVSSLCAAWQAVATYEGSLHEVNLFFDYEDEAIALSSPYTHDGLGMVLKRPGAVSLRLPEWLHSKDVAVTAGPPLALGPCLDGRLLLTGLPVGQPVTLSFPLVERRITLKHRTRAIPVLLRGDAVAAMHAPGADLTFFDPLEI